MSEFTKVLKQWRRMCNSYKCAECPGRTTDDADTICMLVSTENQRTEENVEAIIKTWAAEHPEPVYQLWGEWFEEHGDLISGWHNATNVQWMAHTFSRLLCTPIPADIAQKLGIVPKEPT